jgi:hypothetical protein
MAFLMLGGCTTVHVNSIPSGADVMASYGGNFAWAEWGRECQTPCTFTSAHGVQLRIRWSDGTLSEIRQGDYYPFGATYDFNFDKSATTPITSMKNDTNTSTGKVEQVHQSSVPTTVAQPIKSNAPEELQTFTGRVERIDRLNPGFFGGMSPEGIWFKFSVVSDNGEEASFYEKKKTNITDGEGKPFPNGWRPKKGKKVKVTYSVMPDGIFAGSNEALTIQYLE